MKPDLTLNPPEWMSKPAVRLIMSLLNEGAGDDPKTLFVGGCVRNWLLNKPVQDIDLATKFTPLEVTEILIDQGVKVIPTGIDHGTVTAVVEGQSFEITTLRHDVATDGRHAKVAFTDDWLEDAKRRDFTMNTLLADSAGNIYDPIGSGINDARAGHVVFVGDAAERIAEDYLRILRFFRFHAFYGRAEMDKDALNACRAAADKIDGLSRERITQEFLKILNADNAAIILKTMFDNNVLSDLVYTTYNPKNLAHLIQFQIQYDIRNIEARLFVLAGNKPNLFDEYLRLPHKSKNFIIKLQMAAAATHHEDVKSLKKAIYYHGNDLMVQGYLLSVVMMGANIDDEMINILKNWIAPQCPINGKSLMAEGFEQGPLIGIELQRRIEEWLDGIL